MPSAKRRKVAEPIAAPAEPVDVLPLPGLQDRRKAIKSLDKKTLQRLLLDATEASHRTKTAVEAQFVAKKEAEKTREDGFECFMNAVEEIWNDGSEHRCDDEFTNSFVMASKLEDMMEMEELVNLASSYETKRNALLKFDKLAGAFVHVIDVMTHKEVVKIKADEDAQEAVLEMRRSDLKCVRESLEPVSALIR
ncbi:hypothetical protein LTR22_013260 [Elasticomyces elasticus]|nr:hypothetical protein LTR22_013260 [Elasticomyces elasticus]